MLHNRYLPGWMHRVANGALGGGISSISALAAVRMLGAPLWVFWSVLPVALLCTAVNPRRFSIVEGCAGDVGYDELPADESGKTDAEGWVELR